MNIYEQGLDRHPANHQPLSPVTFLDWSESVYPDRTAVIHGVRRYTYRELGRRCRRLADALAKRGVGVGDTVSIMATNTPEMLETTLAVPMTGAVLNALNYRLDAKTIAFVLNHGESKVLITDREFSPTVTKALALLGREIVVVDIDDELAEGGELLGETDYETFIATGDEHRRWPGPKDEWQALSLCYTSGTTGDPKGVVYHHRGAFLNAIANAMMVGVNRQSVYLWTLPMFHCNGWSFLWTVTGVGATHVCLRKVDPALIFRLIRDLGVTHMCGAPIVLNMLVHAPDSQKIAFEQTVDVVTGGAAPPSPIIAGMERMGFRVHHAYGLTECYGPGVICAWQDAWNDLDGEASAVARSRQGVRYPTLSGLMVANPDTMVPVPDDGDTIGELMMQGNTVMKGYLKNPAATDAAFAGGWFRTGDLGVIHPDGYVEIKDRSKDIIITGGENVSSLEVEEALYRHPEVMEAAVVARPDDYWGETPCAFVTLKEGAGDCDEATIMEWCQGQMARFKVPKTVIFGPLPKTSTGKIQKYVLRERVLNL